MRISFNDMALSERSYRKLVAALLILGAVLANMAFIGLGSVFNYPDILQEPSKFFGNPHYARSSYPVRCPRH